MTLRGQAARNELTDEQQSTAQHAADGQQWADAHSCETGKKKRLYIKRSGPSVLFCCHNCNTSGAFIIDHGRDAVSRIGRLTTTERTDSDTGAFDSLIDRMQWGEVSEAGKLWLSQYWVDPSPRLHGSAPTIPNRLFIAGFDSNGLITCIQGRRLVNNSTPKYLTAKRGSAWGYCYPEPPIANGFTYAHGVITEDLTSALRISMLGIPAVALLGTKPLSGPIPGWEKAHVWLDSDIAGTTGAAKFCIEMAPLFSGGVDMIYSDSEPKELSPEDLMLCLRSKCGY